MTLEDPTPIPIPEVTLAARTPCPIPNATLAAFTSIPIPEEPLADRTTPPIPEVPLIELLQEFAKFHSAKWKWKDILSRFLNDLTAFAEDHPELGVSPADMPDYPKGLGKILRERLEAGRIPGVMLEEKRTNNARNWYVYSTRVL